MHTCMYNSRCSLFFFLITNIKGISHCWNGLTYLYFYYYYYYYYYINKNNQINSKWLQNFLSEMGSERDLVVRKFCFHCCVYCMKFCYVQQQKYINNTNLFINAITLSHHYGLYVIVVIKGKKRLYQPFRWMIGWQRKHEKRVSRQ